MEIRWESEKVVVTSNGERIFVCSDGETYSNPGHEEIPDKIVRVFDLFPDGRFLKPGEWSRYGFYIGPFYFGVCCRTNWQLDFVVKTTAIEIFQITLEEGRKNG